MYLDHFDNRLNYVFCGHLFRSEFFLSVFQSPTSSFLTSNCFFRYCSFPRFPSFGDENESIIYLSSFIFSIKIFTIFFFFYTGRIRPYLLMRNNIESSLYFLRHVLFWNFYFLSRRTEIIGNQILVFELRSNEKKLNNKNK
jgi:hypothetical protein